MVQYAKEGQIGTDAPAKRCWRYEYKSDSQLAGYPLVHIALGSRDCGTPLMAKGWIAFGQYAVGLLVLAQFGLGLLGTVAQFGLAPFVLAQFAAGFAVVGQFALGVFAWGQSSFGTNT